MGVALMSTSVGRRRLRNNDDVRATLERELDVPVCVYTVFVTNGAP